MSNKITQELRKITPAWAGDVMDEHWKRVEKGKFRQRPISSTSVNKYAVEMTNGNWQLSPQSIDFDENGNLMNGQHRLEACRRSGVTIEAFVSRGWPVDRTINIIDQGKPRTLGHLMQMHGHKNSTAIAATVTNLARVAFRGTSAAITYTQADYLLNKLGLINAVETIMSKSTSAYDYQGRFVGPLAFYYSARPKKAAAFAEGVFNLEGERGSPVNLFLNWVKNKGHMRGGGGENYLMGLCACLRAYDNGEEIKYVRLHREAIDWLAGTNPKLRDWIREHVARSGGHRARTPATTPPKPK